MAAGVLPVSLITRWRSQWGGEHVISCLLPAGAGQVIFIFILSLEKLLTADVCYFSAWVALKDNVFWWAARPEQNFTWRHWYIKTFLLIFLKILSNIWNIKLENMKLSCRDNISHSQIVHRNIPKRRNLNFCSQFSLTDGVCCWLCDQVTSDQCLSIPPSHFTMSYWQQAPPVSSLPAPLNTGQLRPHLRSTSSSTS